MKLVIVLFFSILSSLNLTTTLLINTNSNAIIGTWLTGSGKGKVKITQNGNLFEGTIVWLKDPLVNGKPDLDDLNPQKDLRSRPVMGIKVLSGLKFNASSNKWEEGTIYDPENGKSYSCNITQVDEKKIHLRGYIGISLIGRTDTWYKVRDIN
jgi:uncharacterized protein (DUF2147 family)